MERTRWRSPPAPATRSSPSTASSAPRRRGRLRSAPCGGATTRPAARSRRRPSGTAPRLRWRPTETWAPSSCCSPSRTTMRCGSTATACSAPWRTQPASTATSSSARSRHSSSRTASGSGGRASSTATAIRSVIASAGWSSSRGGTCRAPATGSSSGWRCGRGSSSHDRASLQPAGRPKEDRNHMKVGVPTETMTDEYRVSLTPAGVRELVEHGHEVYIQAAAGMGSTIPDAEYERQGARILPDAKAVHEEAELIPGVKEPQPDEGELLRPHHTLFTFLHLAPNPELTKGLCETGATCVAYETVVDDHERLPLLAPMSEVAGKIATQAGAFFLERPLGGRGVLLGGVPGVAAATVMIIGGGVVGQNAAFIAIGMEADVFVYDRNIDRLRELDVAFGGRASTVYSSTLAVEEMLPRADLVIGAVLIHGARAPYVVKRDQLKLMKRRAVLVDVSIDQGGCFETSRPTTHSDPVYEVDGVTHYCVANMPGAVPVTSTFALTNATLPYVLAIADQGVEGAMAELPGLKPGVNVADGKVTHPAVAEGTGMEYTPVEDVLSVTA